MSATGRELEHYLRALWGRAFTVGFAAQPLARSFFDGVMQVLPSGDPPQLTLARAAHAAAHAAFSGPPFEPGALKPIQRVLVSLFEDARVEDLAMRRYPGLRRLWGPFHDVEPGQASVPALLARLSRALFDAAFADPDAWVQKARRLYAERAEGGREASRRLGSLLGHDLGQMRAPFDARQYRVEPAYRDDHSGLWLEPPELARGTAGAAANDAPEPPPPAPRAEHTYPEWDYVIARERPDFCQLRERTAPAASTVDALDRATRALAMRVRRRLVASRRERRCVDGARIDLAALVDARAELAAVGHSSFRAYERQRRTRARFSALLLLDLSESSNDVVAADVTRRALLVDCARLLGVAFEGHELAIHGFCSNGRRDVRYALYKDFGEPSAVALPRLAGLRAEGSTRLGAAVRHGSALLRRRSSRGGLLLVLTDAEPADVDVFDAEYLVEDARVAVQGARRAGVATFGICLPGAPVGLARRIFGRECARLARLAELPVHLARARGAFVRRRSD